MDRLKLLELVCDCEVLRRERDELRARVEQLERALAELVAGEYLDDGAGRVWN